MSLMVKLVFLVHIAVAEAQEEGPTTCQNLLQTDKRKSVSVTEFQGGEIEPNETPGCTPETIGYLRKWNSQIQDWLQKQCKDGQTWQEWMKGMGYQPFAKAFTVFRTAIHAFQDGTEIGPQFKYRIEEFAKAVFQYPWGKEYHQQRFSSLNQRLFQMKGMLVTLHVNERMKTKHHAGVTKPAKRTGEEASLLSDSEEDRGEEDSLLSDSSDSNEDREEGDSQWWQSLFNAAKSAAISYAQKNMGGGGLHGGGGDDDY